MKNFNEILIKKAELKELNQDIISKYDLNFFSISKDSVSFEKQPISIWYSFISNTLKIEEEILEDINSNIDPEKIKSELLNLLDIIKKEVGI